MPKRRAILSTFSKPANSRALTAGMLNELARLRTEAEESIKDVPMRVRLQAKLNKATEDSVSLSHAVLTAESVDIKEKMKVARHFMDRHLFGKSPDEGEGGSYREILRSLNNIDKRLGGEAVVIPTRTDSFAAENGNGASVASGMVSTFDSSTENGNGENE